MESPVVQSKIVVIVPTFNEERFIGSTVIMARKHADLVIVVDDGSTDNTSDVAQCAGAILIQHDQNMGKGAALTTGFKKAVEFESAVIVTIDADGQHLPQEIPIVIKPIINNEADIVIGSRYLESRSKVPTHRILGHKLINSITNLLSGIVVSDSQSGFRAFSPEVVKTLTFQSRGFSVESEMQFIAKEHHWRMVDVPIMIQYKDKPKRSVIMQGMTVLNGILKFAGQYRPLLFFGIGGTILLLIGLSVAIWVVDIYRRLQVLAVGYSIISMLFFVFGWMALLTGITLHSIRGLITELLQTKNIK